MPCSSMCRQTQRLFPHSGRFCCSGTSGAVGSILRKLNDFQANIARVHIL